MPRGKYNWMERVAKPKPVPSMTWFQKLLAMYPPADDDDDENDYCQICLVEDGLCQEAAGYIVEEVAELCNAAMEDVARWMVQNNVSIEGLSISNLTEQYTESLEDRYGT